MADYTSITWLCEHGHHGSSERRTHAEYGFTYSGECSGMVMNDYFKAEPREVECVCECHNHDERKSFANSVRSFAQARADALASFDAEFMR
jgi:hypothetical protein